MSIMTKKQLPAALQGRVSMLYDGGCPLCSKEVAHYRRMDRSLRVNWIDIDADATVLEIVGVSKITAMKHLHVIDRNGSIIKGAYAFAAVWRELPRYHYLAKLVACPGVLPLLDKAYSVFADKRFSRRARCDNSLCS